ncbi:MAG: ImmA/IrrE family metallo-endopeptidase [Planctomycetes bacterium]|nr:ImmA/IrrE family metallo-endopeptidase [Planctomycetota bacterium]
MHKSFDIDSFITSDFTAIYIDENVYDSRPQRYRFSLAHEISHVIIHGDVFEELAFSTITEWKQSVTSIPEKKYGYLEFQANSLAGLILVPPDNL